MTTLYKHTIAIRPSSEKQVTSSQVLDNRVQILQRHLYFSIPTSLLSASIIFLGLFRVANSTLLWSWFTAVLLVSLLRFGLLCFYFKKPTLSNLHLKLFIIGTTLSAILWGIAGSILMPENDLIHQMLIIIILSGVTAGGLQTLQASPIASLSFVSFSIIPVCIWLCAHDSDIYILLSLSMLIYLCFLLMIIKRGYHLLTAALTLRYEKLELFKDLEISNEKLKTEIIEREKIQTQLQYLASHDALTDLPNRTLLNDLFTHALARAKRYNTKIAVLFVDLDHFKEINDKFGHDVGDELLLQIAKRLKENLRSSDVVARMGGDEFIILMEDVLEKKSIDILIKKIFMQFTKAFVIRNESIAMTPSIGISIYPDDGDNSISLLKKADVALYHAKNSGRNKYSIFI